MGNLLFRKLKMGALSANYPFILYSDPNDHKDFIRRLQTNVFSVQRLINAWYCEDAPWLAWNCEDEVRDLLKARMSIIPI